MKKHLDMNNLTFKVGEQVEYDGKRYFIKIISQSGHNGLELKLVNSQRDVASVDGSGFWVKMPDKRLSLHDDKWKKMTNDELVLDFLKKFDEFDFLRDDQIDILTDFPNREMWDKKTAKRYDEIVGDIVKGGTELNEMADAIRKRLTGPGVI